MESIKPSPIDKNIIFEKKTLEEFSGHGRAIAQ